jgi:hypothetical protein
MISTLKRSNKWLQNVILQSAIPFCCRGIGVRNQATLAAAAAQEDRKLKKQHFLLQLDNKQKLAALRAAWPQPAFSIRALKDLLDHDNIAMRDEFREFLKTDLFVPRYNLSLEEERELALKRLQAICDRGFISVLDFKNNPLKIFAAHELAVIDPAMGTKMTV